MRCCFVTLSVCLSVHPQIHTNSHFLYVGCYFISLGFFFLGGGELCVTLVFLWVGVFFWGGGGGVFLIFFNCFFLCVLELHYFVFNIHSFIHTIFSCIWGKCE